MFKPLSDKEEQVAAQIVDAAFQVHKQLGAGFLINFNVPVIKVGINKDNIIILVP